MCSAFNFAQGNIPVVNHRCTSWVMMERAVLLTCQHLPLQGSRPVHERNAALTRTTTFFSTANFSLQKQYHISKSGFARCVFRCIERSYDLTCFPVSTVPLLRNPSSYTSLYIWKQLLTF